MAAVAAAAAAARLAKGGAELVKDFEHVEDDVELDHRLDPHVVVPLAHVEAEEQRRLGDDEQPAQDVAPLVGCELASGKGDCATARRQQAGDHTGQCRLSRTRFAHNCKGLPEAKVH